MKTHVYSRPQIESTPLPGPSAVVCMADSQPQLARIKDRDNVLKRLDLIFNDSREDFGIVRAPNEADAKRLLDFVAKHRGTVPNLVFQCEVGIGRSVAAQAAVERVYGGDHRAPLSRGTHNRTLYRKLLAAAGLEPEPEPKVSLAVRLKYAPDRMQAFILSIQRQRYDNWELVFVTDGPNAAARGLIDRTGDARIKLVETETPMGRWGHPYRQRGIAACTGDLIGLSNDDNYYVPGYFEQMVGALQAEGADLVMCRMLHSYWGWRMIDAGNDLGSWLAKRELVERQAWKGDDFFYDAEYLEQLRKRSARTAVVDRPLFIHN